MLVIIMEIPLHDVVKHDLWFMKNYADITMALIDKGADITITNNEGKSLKDLLL